ncbi:MAG: mitochondrial glycoprotein [Monoraphidium minutum]|nr:MAG: mitochondrial glycoprotein [Monoraphidium minutum]
MALRIVAGLARRAGSTAQQQLLPSLAAAAAASAPLVAAAAGAARAPLLRAAAAAAFCSSRSTLSESLESLISRELKHEETTYEQPEVLAKGPPAPFTFSSARGDGTITLKRDFSGEQVSVDASIIMQESLAEDIEEGEEDEEDYGNEVMFNVTVSRAGSALVFECASDGSYLEIRHVSFEAEGEGGDDAETAYTGPVFDELADPLRDAFRGYLAERGVDEELGEWLRHALYDKEQREYITWLQRVGGFLGGK